eukprot:TRINITY_DN2344_c2_g2_i1.p1 TRINITY_DN2344_c2_g2~~TRINITY_DN2344_c2_g2_i1.p1  ORF type:complete len:1010 (-),score=338.76 TRINITY_DN2344_c2_g2_i1:33-3062(-)
MLQERNALCLSTQFLHHNPKFFQVFLLLITFSQILQQILPLKQDQQHLLRPQPLQQEQHRARHQHKLSPLQRHPLLKPPLDLQQVKGFQLLKKKKVVGKFTSSLSSNTPQYSSIESDGKSVQPPFTLQQNQAYRETLLQWIEQNLVSSLEAMKKTVASSSPQSSIVSLIKSLVPEQVHCAFNIQMELMRTSLVRTDYSQVLRQLSDLMSFLKNALNDSSELSANNWRLAESPNSWSECLKYLMDATFHKRNFQEVIDISSQAKEFAETYQDEMLLIDSISARSNAQIALGDISGAMNSLEEINSLPRSLCSFLQPPVLAIPKANFALFLLRNCFLISQKGGQKERKATPILERSLSLLTEAENLLSSHLKKHGSASLASKSTSIYLPFISSQARVKHAIGVVLKNLKRLSDAIPFFSEAEKWELQRVHPDPLFLSSLWVDAVEAGMMMMSQQLPRIASLSPSPASFTGSFPPAALSQSGAFSISVPPRSISPVSVVEPQEQINEFDLVSQPEKAYTFLTRAGESSCLANFASCGIYLLTKALSMCITFGGHDHATIEDILSKLSFLHYVRGESVDQKASLWYLSQAFSVWKMKISFSTEVPSLSSQVSFSDKQSIPESLKVPMMDFFGSPLAIHSPSDSQRIGLNIFSDPQSTTSLSLDKSKKPARAQRIGKGTKVSERDLMKNASDEASTFLHFFISLKKDLEISGIDDNYCSLLFFKSHAFLSQSCELYMDYIFSDPPIFNSSSDVQLPKGGILSQWHQFKKATPEDALPSSTSILLYSISPIITAGEGTNANPSTATSTQKSTSVEMGIIQADTEKLSKLSKRIKEFRIALEESRTVQQQQQIAPSIPSASSPVVTTTTTQGVALNQFSSTSEEFKQTFQQILTEIQQLFGCYVNVCDPEEIDEDEPSIPDKEKDKEKDREKEKEKEKGKKDSLKHKSITPTHGKPTKRSVKGLTVSSMLDAACIKTFDGLLDFTAPLSEICPQVALWMHEVTAARNGAAQNEVKV